MPHPLVKDCHFCVSPANNTNTTIVGCKHAITSVGQSVRSEKTLSENSKKILDFFLRTAFCHARYFFFLNLKLIYFKTYVIKFWTKKRDFGF